jgi:hypothetical protein
MIAARPTGKAIRLLSLAAVRVWPGRSPQHAGGPHGWTASEDNDVPAFDPQPTSG